MVQEETEEVAERDVACLGRKDVGSEGRGKPGPGSYSWMARSSSIHFLRVDSSSQTKMCVDEDEDCKIEGGVASQLQRGCSSVAPKLTVCTENPFAPFSLTLFRTFAPPPAPDPIPLPVPRRTIKHSYLSLKLPSPLWSCLTQSRRGKSVRMRKRSRGGLARGLSDLTIEGEEGTRMAVLKTTFSSGRRGMDLVEEGGCTRCQRLQTEAWK